ncbi:MAG: RNA-binding domain-containing protein [Solirubrobacteraceae bacterium]
MDCRATVAHFHESVGPTAHDWRVRSQNPRRLALADLDDDALRRLVAHGEDRFVERKRQLPDRERLGAVVASFANTLGGWLLVGVADDGEVIGFDAPARLDLQSHLGNLLRLAIDPLPPFLAGVRELDGRRVGLVRVFETDDAPVIVRGTGGVYVRDAGGMQPVADHRTLVELARRGERAREDAERRLVQEPLVAAALRPLDAKGLLQTMGARPAHTRRTIVRAAPLTVSPTFVDWPMSRSAAAWLEEQAASLAGGNSEPHAQRLLTLEPHGRGAVARCEITAGPLGKETATVVADSAGVVGAEMTHPRRDANAVMLDETRAVDVEPLLTCVVGTLQRAEAHGRALVDVWLLLPPELSVRGAPRTASEMHASGEVVIPADDGEIAAQAASWQREFERNVGIASFERDHPRGSPADES